MHEKTKVVEVGGQRWQLRRMTPVDGSYCWQRIMAATYRSAQATQKPAEQLSAAEEARMEEAIKKATPEQRLRTTCGMAFMSLTYDETKFMHKAGLGVTCRLESLAGVDTPMPVVDDSGRFAVQELEGDPALVTQLVTEALVFNLLPFMAENTTTATGS